MEILVIFLELTAKSIKGIEHMILNYIFIMNTGASKA